MLKFLRALIAMDNAVQRAAEMQQREELRREALEAKLERDNRAARMQDLRIELLELKLEREREKIRRENELARRDSELERLLEKHDLTPDEFSRLQSLQANR